MPDAPDALRDEARKVLAWEDIDDEKGDLRLDEAQLRQLEENVKKARRDVKEAVWRTYKNLMLLGKDSGWKTIDLGLVHSSAAPSIAELMIERLRQEGDLEAAISPNFLARNWPPAFKEWSTKSARDAFFASPQFPRLLNPDSLKDTIARGVENGMLGYVGKKPDGSYPARTFGLSMAGMYRRDGQSSQKSIHRSGGEVLRTRIVTTTNTTHFRSQNGCAALTLTVHSRVFWLPLSRLLSAKQRI